MSEKNKKMLRKLYATGLILLAALLTISAMFPVLKFEDPELDTTLGSFTEFSSYVTLLNVTMKLAVEAPALIASGDPFEIFVIGLSGASIFFLLLFSLIFPMIILITFVVKLIQFFVYLKKDDVEKLISHAEGFPFVAFPIAIFLPLLVERFLGGTYAISVGNGMIVVCIAAAIAILLRAVKSAVCAGNDRVGVIVKQSLTLVSICAILVMLANFSAPQLYSYFAGNYETFLNAYQGALLQQGKADPSSTAAAATIIFRWVSYALTVFGTVFCFATLAPMIERLEYKTPKRKKVMESKSLLTMVIILLVVAVVPVALNAPDKQAQAESYEQGIFKTCYTAYLVDGSSEKAEYDALQTACNAKKTQIETLQTQLVSAQGEQADALRKEIAKAEFEIKGVERDLERMETAQTKATLCLAMAILILVLEIAYILVHKLVCVKQAPLNEAIASEQAPASENTPAEDAFAPAKQEEQSDAS
ncbi:MAG: hypothetical protein IIX86_04895 [Clostridia bacterium]|nr:hypothetical protein [Clostridia bacterium]